MKWTILITLIFIGPTFAGRGGGGAHYGAGTNSFGPGYTFTQTNTPVNGVVSTYTVKANPGPVVHGSGPTNHAPFHNHAAGSKIYNLQPGPNGIITLPSPK